MFDYLEFTLYNINIEQRLNKVQMTTISNTPQSQPDKLRIDFVGMAFALAIGEIGLQIGKLYENGIRLRDYPYLATHIALAVYIIASSWIGWNLSESKINREKARDPFTVSFLVLLIDLLLVICYFIVVQCIGRNPKVPDCRSQIYWSLVIFIIYFIWDLFSKVIVEDDITLKVRIISSKKEWADYLNRAYQVPICFLMIYFLIKPIGADHRSGAVVCGDLLLIFTFVLFRGAKGFKNNWRKFPLYVGMPLLLFIATYCYYQIIL